MTPAWPSATAKWSDQSLLARVKSQPRNRSPVPTTRRMPESPTWIIERWCHGGSASEEISLAAVRRRERMTENPL